VKGGGKLAHSCARKRRGGVKGFLEKKRVTVYRVIGIPKVGRNGGSRPEEKNNYGREKKRWKRGSYGSEVGGVVVDYRDKDKRFCLKKEKGKGT